PLARGKVAVRDLAIACAQKGFVGVAVGYRHRPQGEFLAPIHDAKAAVRWLRTQVKKYPIDPDRIGAGGFSAGSSPACLLGMTAPDDGLEGDDGPNLPSSRVQAVVGYFGPSDMKALYDGWTKSKALSWFERKAMQGTVESWLGGSPAKVEKRYSQLSPI